MGAWGEGMLANDTALDFLSYYEEENAFSTIKIRELIEHALRYDKSDHQATLGICEFLMNKGYSLVEYQSLILPKVDQAKREIFDWNNYRLRLDALERFEARVKGEKIDQELVDHDNRGLFQRIYEASNN